MAGQGGGCQNVQCIRPSPEIHSGRGDCNHHRKRKYTNTDKNNVLARGAGGGRSRAEGDGRGSNESHGAEAGVGERWTGDGGSRRGDGRSSSSSASPSSSRAGDSGDGKQSVFVRYGCGAGRLLPATLSDLYNANEQGEGGTAAEDPRSHTHVRRSPGRLGSVGHPD